MKVFELVCKRNNELILFLLFTVVYDNKCHLNPAKRLIRSKYFRAFDLIDKLFNGKYPAIRTNVMNEFYDLFRYLLFFVPL